MAKVDWRRGLAKVLVPAALAFGYLLWRDGGTLPSSLEFWGLVTLVSYAPGSAVLASFRP